jgi:hypothetical protein
MDDDPRSRAARTWFGYGKWDAPYWFVGMEPGGTDHPALYTSWEACGGGPLIDAKRHEEEWNARVPAALRTHYFADKPKIQKSTWQPLIHILLGFTGSNEDAHLYQRDKWGRIKGETALIELSVPAFANISVKGDRGQYELERIDIIRKHLEKDESIPTLAVFYGKSYQAQYEEIAGGPFDKDGFRWNGSILCALTTHPSRPTRTYEYWTEYGKRLRQNVEALRDDEKTK